MKLCRKVGAFAVSLSLGLTATTASFAEEFESSEGYIPRRLRRIMEG